jgi:hypothetical protein
MTQPQPQSHEPQSQQPSESPLSPSEIAARYRRFADRVESGEVIGCMTLNLFSDGTVAFITHGVLRHEHEVERLRWLAQARADPQ